MDVLSSSILDKKIAWYENTDGLGNFGVQQIISINSDGASSVFAIDIDNDGDIDVLSASLNDHKIAWYENIDGLGDFSDEKIITTNALGGRHVFADDIDNDGDIDVLSASDVDDKFAWYENIDGRGSFGTQQIISTNAEFARTIMTGDIDNDGDKDLICSSGGNDTVAWFENSLNTLSINYFELSNILIFPNPAQNNITIKSKLSVEKISIYSINGRLLKSKKIKNIQTEYGLDISKLSKGFYFIQIQSGNSKQQSKFIKE
jgi:hypothetical protein